MDKNLKFTKGKISGVIVKPLSKFLDERGWLCELFRSDEIPSENLPAMAYISMTLPNVTRGPHEHVEQTDIFCFLGSGNFKVYLWDCRKDSETCGTRQIVYAGADSPATVIVPPGVVHAYKNISNENGIVFNAPDRLYDGEGKKMPVDEIRHEEDSASSFLID